LRKKENRRQKREKMKIPDFLFRLLSYSRFPTNPIASNREPSELQQHATQAAFEFPTNPIASNREPCGYVPRLSQLPTFPTNPIASNREPGEEMEVEVGDKVSN
jgi:hypothetical protein